LYDATFSTARRRGSGLLREDLRAAARDGRGPLMASLPTRCVKTLDEPWMSVFVLSSFISIYFAPCSVSGSDFTEQLGIILLFSVLALLYSILQESLLAPSSWIPLPGLIDLLIGFLSLERYISSANQIRALPVEQVQMKAYLPSSCKGTFEPEQDAVFTLCMWEEFTACTAAILRLRMDFLHIMHISF
jgi:hypothetical protein